MERLKKKICLGLVCLLAVCSLSGCDLSVKMECNQMIKEFEQSCRELNVEGMLNCITPTISDPIRALMALGNMVTGEDTNVYLTQLLENLMGNLTETFGTEESGDTSEIVSTFKLNPKKFDLSSKSGIVVCEVTFTVNEEEYTRTLNIDVIKKNKSWYIEGLRAAEE